MHFKQLQKVQLFIKIVVIDALWQAFASGVWQITRIISKLGLAYL